MSPKLGDSARRRQKNVQEKTDISSTRTSGSYNQRTHRKTEATKNRCCWRFFQVSIAVFSALLTGLLVLYLWPSKFQPVPFVFTKPPDLIGTLAPNTKLASAKQMYKGLVKGPECIVAHEGSLYTGTADGKVLRLTDGQVSVLAKFGPKECAGLETYDEGICGRPLGMIMSPVDRMLWVLDASLGLYTVNITTGAYTQVLSAASPMGGSLPRFLNDVTMAPSSGKVYISDTSVKWRRSEFFILGIETNFDGRILEYDPVSKETVEVCNGVGPNGIQMAPDERSLLLSDTTSARILRCHIAGEKRGLVTIVNDQLPGFPDNIRLTPRGTYWVAMTAVRYPTTIIEKISPYPWMKELLYKSTELWNSRTVKSVRSLIPSSKKPIPPPSKRYGLVVEMADDGEIVRSLHDPSGVIRGISHVQEHEGTLYLGSAANHYVGILDL